MGRFHVNAPLLRIAPVLLLIFCRAAAADPVEEFIAAADSLSRSEDGALERYVAANPAIVGAAVARLLDAGFDAGMGGDTATELENVDFAERVASVHAGNTGEQAVLETVRVYRGWGESQRQTRARAMALHDEADAARNTDPDRAIRLYDQALPLYEQINDLHSIAVLWGGKGVAWWYKGDFDAVEERYTRALAARRAVDDRILVGRTLNGLGSVSLRRGDFSTAADYYSQAIAVRRSTGDLKGLGTSITYLGHCYSSMGRPVDARDRYEEALPILEAQGSAGQMVDVLNGIAICYSNMGRTQRAAQTYRRAAEYARAAGETEKEIQCRMNLADDYRLSGRYADAFDELEVVEERLREHPDDLSTRVFFRTRGMTWAMVGAMDRARDDLLESIRMAETQGDAGGQMEGLINVAWLYRKLGAVDRGLESAGRAKALAEQNADGRKYRDAIAIMGNLYADRGDYARALEYWTEALAQDEHDGFDALVLRDRISIASYRAAMGDSKAALAEFETIEPAVLSSDSPTMVTLFHLGVAHAHENTDPEIARNHYEAALSTLELSRSKLGADESRSSFLSGERRYYFEEVARYYASLDGGRNGEWSDEAFRTIERAKARALLDLIASSEASRTTDDEEAVLDEMYRLDPQENGYDRKRTELKNRLDHMRAERMRRAAGTLESTGQYAGLEAVRKSLDKHTVLLQYALGDTASFLWAVDRNGHRMYRLANRAGLEPEVTRFKDAVRQPGMADATLKRCARALYVALLEPAADRLEGARNLVIIPDGFLHEVPFEALLTGEPDPDSGWEDLPYLARSHSTVYAPSATVYLRLSGDRRGKYDRDLIAYGDPDFSLFDKSGGNFEPLPFARAEIASLSDLVKQENRLVRTGAAASEADFKHTAGGTSARVLHFATHGLVSPAEPGRSSVVLCPDDAGMDDGYLRATEILSMRTRAGVVVISACETARGRVTRGEGVVGLSRAFIAAGADGVVASLWAVSDESTERLMQEFYKQMIGGKRPAGRAMREARMDLIGSGRFSHPFYWSPFVVIGAEKAPW